MHLFFTVQLEDAGDGGDDSGEESGGDDDDEDKERAEDEEDEDMGPDSPVRDARDAYIRLH